MQLLHFELCTFRFGSVQVLGGVFDHENDRPSLDCGNSAIARHRGGEDNLAVGVILTVSKPEKFPAGKRNTVHCCFLVLSLARARAARALCIFGGFCFLPLLIFFLGSRTLHQNLVFSSGKFFKFSCISTFENFFHIFRRGFFAIFPPSRWALLTSPPSAASF